MNRVKLLIILCQVAGAAAKGRSVYVDTKGKVYFDELLSVESKFERIKQLNEDYFVPRLVKLWQSDAYRKEWLEKYGKDVMP